LNSGQTPRIKSELILQAIKFKETFQYKIGNTKVFLKATQEAVLEKLRDVRIAEIILSVQSAARGYLAKRNYDKLLEKIISVEMIQRNVRSYFTLKKLVMVGVIYQSKTNN